MSDRDWYAGPPTDEELVELRKEAVRLVGERQAAMLSKTDLWDIARQMQCFTDGFAARMTAKMEAKHK